MALKRIVLADTDIIFNLIKFQFFDLLEQLAKYYSWDLYITYSIENECKDHLTTSFLKSKIRNKNLKYFEKTSSEIAKSVVELNKIMTPGAEIELYAIAKCENCNILSDDRENCEVFFKNYTLHRGKLWIYNLYHVLYLAYKAALLTIGQIDNALTESHKSGIRHLDYRILNNGFSWYCHEIEKYIDRHIDPVDSEKFKI
ncbi:MAG: hypothetical protein JSU85_10815 [Candidatus Zixiibacteriota bacterium]|nr:MAG: hypothetical protein JSU85_10815 [candidate division Zixibacteria bacterium]